MSMQHLKSLVDFVSKECITAVDVQQGIESAQPFPHQGFIISGPTAPNVVANPELADFFWSETDGGYIPLGNIYYYNGSSWQLFALIDGSRLANHSVTLVKLSMAGSSAYDIIQVDATGAQLIYIAITDAIQNGTLGPSKLLGPGAGKFVLASTANAYASIALLTFLQTVIDDNTLPIAKLVRYVAPDTLGAYLRTKLDGTGMEWARVDIANLGAIGYLAGQSARRNAGNTAWEAYTPTVHGPVFLGAPVVVYTGGAIGWTLYSASAATLAGKQAAILQVETLWNTATDGQATVMSRPNSGGPALLVGRAGSVDAVATANQATVAITTDGKLEYEVVVSGAATPSVTISLVGYFQ